MAKSKSPEEVFNSIQKEEMDWKLDLFQLLKADLAAQAKSVKEAGQKAAEILERVGN